MVKNSVYKILKELRKMINYKNRHLEKSTFLREKEGEGCAHLLRAHLLISPTEQLDAGFGGI